MFDPERFVTAQAPVIEAVRRELRAGRKQSHWMWFVFPQLRGLGRSEMALRYGIEDLAEARAFLDHAVLGPRLEACTGLVALHADRTAEELATLVSLPLRRVRTLLRTHREPPAAAVDSPDTPARTGAWAADRAPAYPVRGRPLAVGGRRSRRRRAGRFARDGARCRRLGVGDDVGAAGGRPCTRLLNSGVRR